MRGEKEKAPLSPNRERFFKLQFKKLRREEEEALKQEEEQEEGED